MFAMRWLLAAADLCDHGNQPVAISPSCRLSVSPLCQNCCCCASPLPFYLSTTTWSLNLLSGVQMPCRVLPVWVQIILQMTNMPEWEWAGGSVVWRLSFQENCQGAVEQGSERLSRAAYTLKNIPQWLHVFFIPYVPLLICPSSSSSSC